MIPSGHLAHDHLTRTRAAVHHPAWTPDIEPSQRAAQAAIERLLASWDSDTARGLEAAHLWEDAAMDAIDALSVLLGAVDLAESSEPAQSATAAPRLISPRARP